MRGKIEDRDQRNYMREASRLVTGLSIADLYSYLKLLSTSNLDFVNQNVEKN